eukprot:jgi/Chrzof1/3462/Cz12g26140.t1
MVHTLGVNSVAWNAQGNYLASVSDDQTVKIWDVEKGTCLRTMTGHSHYVFCCQFNPVGHVLATGSFDETIRFWDVRSGRCLREIPAHSDPITALDFNPDATLLVSSSFDGLMRIWDTHSGHCLRTLASDAQSTPVNFVCFSPNGRYILEATLDSKLRLVNFENGKVAKTYVGHKNEDYSSSMAFVSPIGPYVVSGSEDNSVVVWDVNSKQVVQHMPGREAPDAPGDGHCDAVLSVASHPRLPMLATGGHEKDSSIKIWTASSQQ